MYDYRELNKYSSRAKTHTRFNPTCNILEYKRELLFVAADDCDDDGRPK